MELFYNPERMTEREIKETFIAHQWLVNEIISILKRQPDGPGVQHVVIVAPRGMGKTTMLLMLRFTLLANPLGQQWQPVNFPEESYGVNELADLWLAVLNHLASETRDSELYDDISAITSDASHLEETALARIKNWRAQNGKRLMLLIDNFDMILDQIGDERENARLRDVLINDGTLMLVGGAPAFFKEARAYDQPLYNLFKIYNLNSLDPKQIRDLLRRRAELDGKKDFDETLRKNESRIRVLEYFTGGNPRLVLMLYRIITHSDISEVRRGLEKLLDEVTPYYKAKIETLPAQQRKILDQIARSTSRTREGMTPTDIAAATRLPVNQVSSQLKRLSEAGYVHTANTRGRSSFYTLSEPLYAIWYQMRFGRDARKRMNWLVLFLKNWYDAEELGTECARLRDIFLSYLRAGRKTEASDALEHLRYLMEAIEDSPEKVKTFESIVLSHPELSDLEKLKDDILADVDTNLLSEEKRQRLNKAKLVSDENVDPRLNDLEVDRLVLNIRNGNEPIDSLLEHPVFKRRLKIICRTLASNPTDAEDLYNETCFRVWLKIDQFHPTAEGSFFRWLRIVVRHLYIDRFRRRSLVLDDTRSEEQYDVRDPGADPFAQLIQAEMIKQLNELILGQKETERLVLTYFFQDRSYREIAEILQTKHGIRITHITVRTKVRNILQKFFDTNMSKPKVDRVLTAALSAELNDLKGVKAAWNGLMQSPDKDSNKDRWLLDLNSTLRSVALAGHWAFAKELIVTSHLEDTLFPLARALDYLLTNDVSLIERLSPEVKQIVNEIITTLKQTSSGTISKKQKEVRAS
jgi:RNA polymerase sigma factor (sigma-70 family)